MQLDYFHSDRSDMIDSMNLIRINSYTILEIEFLSLKYFLIKCGVQTKIKGLYQTWVKLHVELILIGSTYFLMSAAN